MALRIGAAGRQAEACLQAALRPFVGRVAAAVRRIAGQVGVKPAAAAAECQASRVCR